MKLLFVVRSILVGLSLFFLHDSSWHFDAKLKYTTQRVELAPRLRWVIVSHGWHDFSILNIYYTIYNFKEQKKFVVS